MAKKVYEESNIRAIATAIREKTGSDNTYKTSEMASGIGEVFEAGKQKAQQLLADSYQDKGKRINYALAYAGYGWNDYTFEQSVAYDIAPAGANQMFQYSQVKDVAGIMNRKGIKFDFITNKPTQCFSMFSDSAVEYLPEIIMPTTSSAYGLVLNCTKLISIEKLVCNEKTAFQTSSGANKSFQGCSRFTHCIFSGVITNDIYVRQSPLDDESLVSLSVTLCDLIMGSYGDGWGSRTLTLSAESIARLKELTYPESDYSQDGASCYEVITARKGWAIA